MDDPIMLYAIAFLVIAVILFVIELFLPSGGLLGVLSIICVIAAVICLFLIDTTLGMVGLLIMMVAVPVAIGLAMKVMPHTYIGKKLILADQQNARVLHYEEARDAAPDQLIGKSGQAVSGLRPVGTCKIGDDRLECLSISGAIEPGTPVEVVSVDGIEIRVKAVNR